ncbi:ABC-three component system protein [Kordiimonas sp.]|uniref:ABC-three component system protein n=1 Tax=Kordiimonas sp. TaxID=1970157 RepID=UPI003A95114B
MITFVSQNNNSSLILFVHGFTGSDETWDNKNGTSFPVLLSSIEQVSDKYDVACFSYYTKLFNLFSSATNWGKRLGAIFKVSHQKLKKNISVEEISNLLGTEIRFRLAKYDNIIIVAHSMGGLVTKSYIVNEISAGTPSRVNLFLSLAVPHAGANAATFGKLVSSNIQIENLDPLNAFIHKINDEWLQTSLRPTTKYFYGTHDDVVPKTSASPSDKQKNDVIALDENHTSICKPEGIEETTFQAVLGCILEQANTDAGVSDIQIQNLENEDDYDDELFVLKLIVADIQQATVKDAKKTFLNAEFIRKKFSSEVDRKRFSDLYHKVETLYKSHYSEFLHGTTINSGQLLARVHQAIIKEDRQFLHCQFMPFLNAIHKQGMLHQLANNEAEDVWWTKESGTEFLKEALEAKGQ